MSQVAKDLVDVDALTAYMRDRLDLKAGTVEVEKHTAGFSNETFYVSCGPDRWVMRRPPRGEVLPTAHDVVREFRALSGLHPLGVRVPKPALLCEDPSVIGAPFYLMERVEGSVIRAELPAYLDSPEERRRIGAEMIEALVEMHGAAWRGTVLENLGREGGYLERQVKRWSSQIDLTLPRTRPLPGLQEVTDWLKANIPQQAETTVVHGDYKLDNVMWAPGAPARLIAIFDWEMSTLGDPLADLGWMMRTWGVESTTNVKSVTHQPGFMSREEMVELYGERSGRVMKDYKFYSVLAAWKGIAITEGLYMHYVEGTASNPGAREFEWTVPQSIEAVLQTLHS
jgi:aminoglycoside phosphotransferase (APT) family kinase protein